MLNYFKYFSRNRHLIPNISITMLYYIRIIYLNLTGAASLVFAGNLDCSQTCLRCKNRVENVGIRLNFVNL